MKWLLIVALGLALTYEGIAAISRHWLTISQLTWGLEKHMPIWAVILFVGYVVLGIHLFLHDWKKG